MPVATITLERVITHTSDGRRCYVRRYDQRECVVLVVRAQYLSVRTPSGDEVWVDRSVGTVSAPRGGVPGVQGAPGGARPCAWRAWTLTQRDLSAYWVEGAQAEAAARREDARRERESDEG